MKQTQEQFVITHLKEHGKISRNFCLQNFISRLGAIICNLNQNGWDIQGNWVKTDNGRDYVYTLLDRPKKKVSHIEVIDGVAVETFDEVAI
jgi:hypothetical protein